MAMVILIAIATFFSTLLGGLFALKFRDKLHLILGFSAGAVIAVAFFDLLPESLELGGTTAMVALGFIIYLILDRFIILHSDHDDTVHRGFLGAGSLSIHSFLDGFAIGLAFQVSRSVGLIVTATVLMHSFVDGINTISLITKNGGTQNTAMKWLIGASLAPVIGVVATFFIHPSPSTLGILLALFAGFFIYIGASELLPESHHSHPTKWTTIMTIIGIAVLYGAIQLAG